MSKGMKEEAQIAKEQDEVGTALNSDRFFEPISELNLPPVIGMEEDSKIIDAIELMQKKNIGSIVVTSKGKLTGIFTERDVLMKVVGKMENWEDQPLTSVMTKEPQTLMKHDQIAYVLNNMHVGGFRHIPIVDEFHKPHSMASIKDVVSWILEHFPSEILNKTGEPFRKHQDRDIGG